MTDCKLRVVWLEIEVDSAGSETAGLGLAQVGQHTQGKKKKTFAVTRLLSAGYHCYDGNGNLVVSALVQAVTAESALMNAENGAFLLCNASQDTQRSGETNIKLSIKLYVWNILLSANKLGLWFLNDAFRLPGQIKHFLSSLRFDLEATSDLHMILVRNVKQPGWRGQT